MIFGPKDYISISKHAGEKFRMHCESLCSGLTGSQMVDLVRATVHTSGLFGGQLGETQRMLKPWQKGLDHIVFVVIDTKESSHAGGKLWAVKTVLSEDEAMANIEAFCPQRRG